MLHIFSNVKIVILIIDKGLILCYSLLMRTIAIILASGVGSRLGLDIPKQFYKIKEKTVLEYSISADGPTS